MILHVEKEEIDEIQIKIQGNITKQTNVVFVIAFLLCMVTLSVILILSYSISMSISKPLTRLIKIADIINDNATEKNFISNLDEDLKNLPEVLFFSLNFTVL